MDCGAVNAFSGMATGHFATVPLALCTRGKLDRGAFATKAMALTGIHTHIPALYIYKYRY